VTAPISSHVAAAVIAELIRRGVRDLIVCPGSRSQALALAAAEAEHLGRARLHVRIDERSAAFTAIGIARETGVPAAVIVTSGTAVANLYPAVLEAAHARLPLILLTADRPPELQGIRANQTMQRGSVFAEFARWAGTVEALDEATADQASSEARLQAAAAFTAAFDTGAAGPAHLNIEFRDPLSGGEPLLNDELSRDIAEIPEADAEGDPEPDTGAATNPDLDEYVYGEAGEHPRAVVIAGADAGAAAADFARDAGLPLLAEPSSGARFGREAIQHWEHLLRSEELSAVIESVVVFGHPTLTRVVPALIQRDEVRTIVIDPAGSRRGIDRFNPGRRVAAFARSAAVAPGYDPRKLRRWLGSWVVTDRELRSELSTLHEPDLEAARATGYKERNAYARAEVAALREPVSREHLAEVVWGATWPHDRLVVAASRLIRTLNRMAAPRNIRVHANRGLAGIDGTVATALGVAIASQAVEDPARSAGTTRVLIGDLALLHDVGSLLLPDAESEVRPRIQLFVANDGGGTIFDTLEAAGTAPAEAFDRVMYTPQQADLASIAAGYGWQYERVSTRGELDRLLTAPVTGPMIVEVPLAR